MRNINFPFERRPASTGMAQRGLASIPRYAEGAEEEIEEKEESTLDQIISYLLEHSGILPEGLSIEGLLGGEGMAHGGVVPGTNPIQGQKDGPTVGFTSPLSFNTEQKNMMYYAKSRVDLGLMDRETANNIIRGPDGQIRSGAGMRAQINAGLIRNQPEPVQQESTYTPTGAQNFGDLAVAPKVLNPVQSYVVGSPTREELYAQYFPPNNPAVQQQQATGLPQLTEDQLLGLAELV